MGQKPGFLNLPRAGLVLHNFGGTVPGMDIRE